jgi:glycosyltransferase involved in cell wall biosynthesis
MRIAFNAWFWNEPTTGSGQYTRRLVEQVAALEPDLEVGLVAPSGSQFQVSSLGAQAPSALLSKTLPPRPRAGNLGKVWFEQVSFPRACRRLGTDIAHVPYWAPPAVPSVPTIVTIHDLIPLLLREYRGGPLVRLYTSFVCATAQSAALVLTDSEASKRDIVAHLGLPAGCVRVIHLAAGEGYNPATGPDDEAVRARYDLPERYVLYLGGFDVRKNVSTVLSTFRWAGPVIGAECPLVIAGQLPQRDSSFAPDPRRLAYACGVDEQFVRFVGFVKEAHKPALYRAAVALIFPSRYEGFGLPPLEALACGTPVVGSHAASMPEVVGDAGVLLAPDDAEGMAGALIQLATDGEFAAEMSRRALDQAAHFSWERAARETVSAYRAVL